MTQKSIYIILTLIIAFSGITFAAKCDGNPITKKFKPGDCDSRDVNVLLEIIEVNNLTKTAKSVFGKKKAVSMEPFDVGIQTWSYGRLISLNISGFNISKLPESIGVLTTLEKLNISHNNIESLPENFGKMKPLKYLYLSDNRLKHLPESISKMDRLRQLDLSNNKLAKLPDKFGGMKSLKFLNLKNNLLSKLPQSFSKFRSLEKLELSNNKLTTLPSAISDLARLKQFYARNNKIIKLPENIGNLRNLEILILTGNQISVIPRSIGNCHELLIAGFNENNLNTLPDEIGQLPLLEELHCNGNKLKNINESFSGLDKLVTLNISKNNLKSLPDDLAKLKNIEFADLSMNQFNKIPDIVFSWNRLKSLNLEHNKIILKKNLNGEFPHLEILNLSNNNISKFDDFEKVFTNLIHLDLSNNNLETITTKFENESSIKRIDLSGNFLEEIPKQFCSNSNIDFQFDYNAICKKQSHCSMIAYNSNRQLCAEQVVVVEEIVQVIQEEKSPPKDPEPEPEPEIIIAEKPKDVYPILANPVKQKLFDQSKITISEKIIPDTLFGLIDSPEILFNVQPEDTFYNYSSTSEISVNNHTIDEFEFLETIGENDILSQLNDNLLDEINIHLDNSVSMYSIPARYSKNSSYYKLGNIFGWLSLGFWTEGIMLTISEDERNFPLLVSSIYFLYLNKRLGNKRVVKYKPKPPLHLKQQLSHDQLIALAEDYNHKMFEEIRVMD